tara:strand:- start:3219 stop:3737 length:519 start_codon:yes stop_codon:yes gene_type:complete
MTKWARVQLPTGNGIVQETTTSNPAGKYHPNITWVEVTAGNSPSGDIAAVGVRYSYEPTPSPAFTAPVFVTGNAKLFNSGSFIPSVSFTGSGDWNWTTIGIVNLLATISTTQVVAFSTQLFDSNLVVAPTTIIMPSGSGYSDYQGGANDAAGGTGPAGGDPSAAATGGYGYF